jgi:hypothetical protein
MANNGTAFIEEIYGQTYQLGLVETQDQFSQKICGKSPRWYSVVVSNSREPSVSSLWNMAANLNKIGSAERSRNTKRVILELHNKVMAKLQDKTIHYEV